MGLLDKPNGDKILFIDFETVDPYMLPKKVLPDWGREPLEVSIKKSKTKMESRKAGGGWVYLYNNVPGCDFKLLGCGYVTHNNETGYTNDWVFLQKLIDEHDYIAAHNLQYDLGCCYAAGLNIKDKPAFCTMITSILAYNGEIVRHNLDVCCRRYGVKDGKDKDSLLKAVIDSGIFPLTGNFVKKRTNKGVVSVEVDEEKLKTRELTDSDVSSWVMSNLDIVSEKLPGVVDKYCIQDAVACKNLFYKILETQTKREGFKDLCYKWSMLNHITTASRLRGLRVDVEKIYENKAKFSKIIKEKGDEIIKQLGVEDINLGSSKQLGEALHNLGYDLPVNLNGYSVTASVLSKNKKIKIFKDISEYREAAKLIDSFTNGLLDLIKWTDPQHGKVARIYPQLNILKAQTGRFSCTNPNMQQMPARGQYADDIRACFLPEEGELWFSSDFSDQEGRIQAHFGKVCNGKGINDVVKAYWDNPDIDLHCKCAAMMFGLEEEYVIANKKGECKNLRNLAKTINLGLSYGMGPITLADRLGFTPEKAREEGLPDDAEGYAKHFTELYFKAKPYLKKLINEVKSKVEKRGYIITLGRRFVYVDSKHKGMNYLIQGSAADQTVEAMIKAYDLGIKVVMPIHDEICITGFKEDSIKLADCMQNAYKLHIPTPVDASNGGPNMAEGAH